MNDKEKLNKMLAKFEVPVLAFNVGDLVQKSGTYICAPCGYKKRLKKGSTFPRCYKCMKGEKYNGDKFFKNLASWELCEGTV